MMNAEHYRKKYVTEINIDNILGEIEKQITNQCEQSKGKYCYITFRIDLHCSDKNTKEIVRRKLVDLGYSVEESKMSIGYGMGEQDVPCWKISW